MNGKNEFWIDASYSIPLTNDSQALPHRSGILGRAQTINQAIDTLNVGVNLKDI